MMPATTCTFKFGYRSAVTVQGNNNFHVVQFRTREKSESMMLRQARLKPW
jgi:hypothetical protein